VVVTYRGNLLREWPTFTNGERNYSPDKPDEFSTNREEESEQHWPMDQNSDTTAANRAWASGLSRPMGSSETAPTKRLPKKADDGRWKWPININRYDRSPVLTSAERKMLANYAEAYRFDPMAEPWFSAKH
jgi:hypothetical protein